MKAEKVNMLELHENETTSVGDSPTRIMPILQSSTTVDSLSAEVASLALVDVQSSCGYIKEVNETSKKISLINISEEITQNEKNIETKPSEVNHVEAQVENDSDEESTEEESSDDQYDSDEGTCKSSVYVSRGPQKHYNRKSNHPYFNVNPNYHFTPNISPSPNESFFNDVGLLLNIFGEEKDQYAEGTPLSDEYEDASLSPGVGVSQLLLSGGGQLVTEPQYPAQEEFKKILNIKADLKSSGNYNKNLNEIIELLEDTGPAYLDILNPNLDMNDLLEFQESTSEETYSDTSSPFSYSSSEQLVFSPGSMSNEEISIPSFYDENARNSESIDNFALVSGSDGSPRENNIETIAKHIPILPKNVLPPNEISSSSSTASSILATEFKGRKPVCRSIHLSNMDKKERDKYHKAMLSFYKKGLGKKSKDGYTYLHCLIAEKNENFAMYFVHLLQKWIEKNPSSDGLIDIKDVNSFINTQDKLGQTALYLSALLNEPRVIKYLLEVHDADATIGDLEGLTPLHIAAQRGEKFLEVVELFCENKTGLNARNGKGQTALHESVFWHLKLHEKNGQMEVINNVPIVEQLLKSGAKLSVQDHLGNTPIHLTILKKSQDLLDTMYCSWKSDFNKAINIKNKNNLTALDLASGFDKDNEQQMKLCETLALNGAKRGYNVSDQELPK